MLVSDVFYFPSTPWSDLPRGCAVRHFIFMYFIFIYMYKKPHMAFKKKILFKGDLNKKKILPYFPAVTISGTLPLCVDPRIHLVFCLKRIWYFLRVQAYLVMLAFVIEKPHLFLK